MKKAVFALMALLAFCAGPVSAQAQRGTCPPTASYSQALFTKAALQARDRGFLWRIERNGRSSFLYGTMHVGKAEWMGLGPGMRKALDQVDTVALEVDMTSDEAQQQLQQVAELAPRVIPQTLRERLERLWVAECLPLDQLSSGPVELQAMTLVALMGRQQGFDPAYASEVMLTMTAHAEKLPVVSLESVSSQLNLMLSPDDADATEAVSQALDQLEMPQTRSVLTKLTVAWEHNDLDVLAHYQDWCDCVHTERERADMKTLLDDRNPGLANGIERLHASGQRVFAAVGALHMTGPLALPRLLAARGFTVQRMH
ncbi:TraB/GumN family protein [Hydrogenophaga sp. PAMC20947]|uniref:TraB/GumN family protein n=1 Tax=Hydrogenophaga sp. PAMC20947 TaxID=2565558 RepID=UPI00109E21F0|nr:TraB/GumN family protein [Hydrogenophaga sp. PAMC20947]QCB45293.1 TraB/GumN family protein [Hydrogenophaga sp. PAMC20947]